MSVKNEEDGLGTGGLIDRAEILPQLWSITHWRLHGPQLERPVEGGCKLLYFNILFLAVNSYLETH